MRRLSIIGAGKVGRTLARLWHDTGTFGIGDVVCSSAVSAAAAVDFIGAGRPLTDLASLATADLLLVTVPDDRLGEVAAALAHGPAVHAGGIAWHCSGALAADELAPLAACGMAVAAAHPLHSFADPARSLDQFAGSWCALDGDPAALAVIAPALEALDARTVAIDSAAKPLYHAAAVVACNYLVALLDTAGQLLAGAGIDGPTGRDLLAPLVRATLENILVDGPEKALTGPIARGDAGLVARQLAAVQAQGEDVATLYRVLGRAVLAIAERDGRPDEEARASLAKILADATPSST